MKIVGWIRLENGVNTLFHADAMGIAARELTFEKLRVFDIEGNRANIGDAKYPLSDVEYLSTWAE